MKECCPSDSSHLPHKELRCCSCKDNCRDPTKVPPLFYYSVHIHTYSTYIHTYIHTYIQYIHTTCIIYQNRKDSKTVHLLFALLYHFIWNMCTVCIYACSASAYCEWAALHTICEEFSSRTEREKYLNATKDAGTYCTYVCMYEYMVHTVCAYWAFKAKARAESYLYGGGISAVYETPECLHSERMRHYFHVFVAYFEQLFSFLQLQHKAMQEPSCRVRSASAPRSFPLSESR